ncbi:hypothetical protein L2E82_12337 [Cichorium intybus]|uniref:Uncharacterized protein n=1 Tax=Cichorium intybus TaxID=13427 RepID=A0ACB9GFY0_CICIN|nr:hypothetical protein L2E82_12337 [Cichorium intybus]
MARGEDWDTDEHHTGGRESWKKESHLPERSAWGGVPETKGYSKTGIEKDNHDIGNHRCNSKGQNNIQEKVIHIRSRADDVTNSGIKKEAVVDYVDQEINIRIGPDLGRQQEQYDEAQSGEGKKEGVKIGGVGSEAQLEDNTPYEILDEFEDQWSDTQRMVFDFDETERKKKKCKKANKLGKKSRKGGEDRRVERAGPLSVLRRQG